MRSSCRKPGCGRLGAISITYDAVACQVWIDPLASVATGGQVLCDDHAQRLSPPRGWVVVDRRDPQSSIVSAPAVPQAAQPPAPRVLRRRWGQFDEARLQFTADDRARPVIAPVEAVVPVAPSPPTPSRVPTFETPPEPAVDDSVDVEVDSVVEEVADVVDEPANEISDDLTALLSPRGRLLARAFEAGGDQKSILTVANGDSNGASNGASNGDAGDVSSAAGG